MSGHETFPWGINADGGSPEYDALVARRLLSHLQFRGVTDRIGARAGVHPGAQAVTLAGTTVTVHPSTWTIYPGLGSTDGPYIAYFLSHTHALDAADGSQQRVDIIVARVYDDDHDASDDRFATTEYIAGTPGGGQPATPSGAVLAAVVTVPAGGSPSPSLNYVAPFTVAAGGVLPVRGTSDLPGAGLFDGMTVFDQAAAEMLVRSGGLWVPPQRGWNHIASGTANDVTNFTIDITDGGRFPAGTFQMIRLHMTGRTSGVTAVVVRMNGDATSNLHQSSFIAWDASSNGAVLTDETEGPAIGGTARIGRWSTSLRTNSIETTFRNTDVSSRNNFQSDSARQPTNAGNFATFSKCWGGLTEDRLLDSLNIRTGALAEDFLGTDWWVEGYRT